MRVCFCHLGRENLGVEYLSSVLKAEGHEVFLAYDPGLFSLNDNVFYSPWLERVFERDEALLRMLETLRPDIVAFSVYTGTYQWAIRMARRIKESINPIVLFGGIHATLVPERVAKEQFCDYCIVGEGEAAIVDLLRELEGGRRGDDVRNVYPNPLRPPILDLDSLPFPDKGLFEQEVNYRDDYMIMTARGCPFHCTYCCESHMNRIYRDRFFRRRSVGSVMEELRVMKKRYNFREVMFNDPIFFTDRKWLEDLMERYRKEIKVPFRCFGKVAYLDEGLVELLEWGGCYAIEFGIQTANEKIRWDILNRKELNEDYKRAFSILDRHGIRYDLDHIFGLPGEEEDDYKDGARLYAGLRKLNRIKCHNLQYFPGLDIVEIAKNKGILKDEDIDSINSGEMKGDFFHLYPLHGGISRRKIKAFQVLFKAIPILPERIVEWIIKGKSYRGLHRIPRAIVVLIQFICALRGRDYRFLIYIKYISLRLRRGMAWSKMGRDLVKGSVLFLFILGALPAGSALKDYGIFHGLALIAMIPAVFFSLRFLLYGRRKKDDERQKGR
jgi:radical SAM superfamily enzyme YgiQ (UPF0313 family)